MKPVFADTAYYGALFNPRDILHAKAVQWSRECRRPIVLTEFILIEMGNALSARPARPLFLRLVRSLRADSQATIIPLSRGLFEEGLRLFADREDKEWSLTDCTSFVVMRRHGIVEALTGDHHFEQAGFTILLR